MAKLWAGKPRIQSKSDLARTGYLVHEGEEVSEVAWDDLPAKDNRRFVPNTHIQFVIERVRLRVRLKR